MNTRRAIVLALTAGAVAPRAVFAQRKLWRIGYLSGIEPAVYGPRMDAFRAGMGARGYNEGRDYTLEIRSSHSDLARLPAMAAELVALKVDLILTAGKPTVLAALKATRSIPILTTTAGDPVGTGLVASLARPGANLTGMTSMSTDLYSKSLDLLRQIQPGLARVGVLFDPDNRIDTVTVAKLETLMKTQGLAAVRAPARGADNIASAMALMVQNKAQAFIATNGSTNIRYAKSIIEGAVTHRLPAAFPRGDYVEAGGLFSYGTDYVDQYRRAADYADRIFRGAKPGDLPIQQPTTFELVINMKTAQALGLKIPQAVLLQATRVIE